MPSLFKLMKLCYLREVIVSVSREKLFFWNRRINADPGWWCCLNYFICLSLLVAVLGRFCLGSYRCGERPMLPFPEVQEALFSHPALHCTTGLTKYFGAKGKVCASILGHYSLPWPSAALLNTVEWSKVTHETHPKLNWLCKREFRRVLGDPFQRFLRILVGERLDMTQQCALISK